MSLELGVQVKGVLSEQNGLKFLSGGENLFIDSGQEADDHWFGERFSFSWSQDELHFKHFE